MVGRPRNAVLLTEEERATLLRWSRSRTGPQARALRARIVLACESEPTNTAVADRFDVSREMVGKWRARFLAERLVGLDEQSRPGRPRTADDDTVAHVLVRTLTPPPSGAGSAWSTRSMAAETGLSQSTVSRVWRTYSLRPGEPATAGRRRAWSLPDHVEGMVGLFLAPPVCVLAVRTRPGGGRAVRAAAANAERRPVGRDRETLHALAVAGAFAALRGKEHAEGSSAVDRPALRAFLERVTAAAGAGAGVHLLAYGVPAEALGAEAPDQHTVPEAEAPEACRQPDTAARPRPRWHRAPSAGAWIDEIRRLLGADAPFPREAASGLPRLRDALLTWSTTWTSSAAPLTLVATARPTYDNSAICERDNDSDGREVRADDRSVTPDASRIVFPTTPPGLPETAPGAPVTTDPLVGALRDTLLAGGHQPGERVREAPLATRLGVSRRVVRAGLRALAEEGMLDPLPGGATAVPAVTAKDVLDLYALRAGLGALLIRRVAMLGPEKLAPASAALAEIRAAARENDLVRSGEVDLRFQDAVARIADLPQAAATFERLTARLRMFVRALDMDYGDACDTITDEDTAIHDALLAADGNEAARLWRGKIERCVRFMMARLPEDDVAPHLWIALAGRPRMRPGDPLGTAH